MSTPLSHNRYTPSAVTQSRARVGRCCTLTTFRSRGTGSRVSRRNVRDGAEIQVADHSLSDSSPLSNVAGSLTSCMPSGVTADTVQQRRARGAIGDPAHGIVLPRVVACHWGVLSSGSHTRTVKPAERSSTTRSDTAHDSITPRAVGSPIGFVRYPALSSASRWEHFWFADMRVPYCVGVWFRECRGLLTAPEVLGMAFVWLPF